MEELKNGEFIVIKCLENNAILYGSVVYIGISKNGKQVIQVGKEFEEVGEGFIAIAADKAKEDAILEIRSLMHRTGLKAEEVIERISDLKSPS